MIGLVLVTHGQLATEFRHAVEHVVGPQDNFETVAIGADDDMEQRRQDILRSIAEVDSGDGAVLRRPAAIHLRRPALAARL